VRCAIGGRWGQTNAIWDDCFDFSQPPRPQRTYTGAPLQDLNWGADVHARLIQPRNLLAGRLEHVFLLPELKALDQRSTVFDVLLALEQHIVALKRMIG
jgi:hypothetical protein